MECLCRADLPYPAVETGGRYPNEVKLLMPVYGGRESETTAILNYVYYAYVSKIRYPELSECFEKIAVVEMRHHELLGNAVAVLGGTPYIGGNYNYWQGNFVNYAKEPVMMLKNSIYAEKQAISDYKNVVSKTKLSEVKAMVERIIMDEELHVATLTELLKTYSA